MKKSTILIIFIVYLASIVTIGFFGMASKVYDETKYVQAIEMSVDAEDEKMFTFEYVGETQDDNKNKMYELYIDFDYAQVSEFEVGGIQMDRYFVALNLIPHVTYDTGDVANAEEESIRYRLDDEELQEKQDIDLKKNGSLYCFKVDTAFRIYVEPAKQSSNEVAVIIDVYVI